jgi:solute carrier family 36 (proton-coupled amino acid transporter)
MLHFKAVAKTRFRKSADILLCIFGLIVMVYTTSLTIKSWASGSPNPGLPNYCDEKNAEFLF